MNDIVKEFIAPKLWSKEDIKKDQDAIRGVIVSLDTQIHQNAIQCVLHAEQHGDTSLMRRLLIDIVDEKTGYRRNSIILWMRAYTPMELVGDVIKLTGMDAEGKHKRPWLIEKLVNTPFYSAKQFADPPIKPMYRDSVLGALQKAIKDFNNAKENTVVTEGKATPIDKTKPFYDGVNLQAMDEAVGKVQGVVIDLSSWQDSTKEARQAAERLRIAAAEVKALEPQLEKTA